MKFIFFTFSGYSLPIAKQLLDEGNNVIVAQIMKPADLGISGWQSQEESPEVRERRLSLYEGILKKHSAFKVLAAMKKIKNKEEYFVVVDHNNLCNIGEQILAMGYTGFIPNKEDFEREKDRDAAHDFVREHYDNLDILESYSLKTIEEGIQIIEESANLWVLKSNGNLAETIVPKVEDIDLNKQQIIGALTKDKKGYEKEGYLLEKKIMKPIEFTPEIAFWNGEPIYSQIEFECKPIGAGDIGSDGGGAINLVVRTELDDEVNKLFFPPIVYEMAKERKGLFIFDAGILYDPDDGKCYFTEFAGNRWSWGGVFSELSMSRSGDKVATNYFESVSNGLNPFNYNFGATVSLYNILDDHKHPEVHEEGIPVYFNEEKKSQIFLYQIKKEEDNIVNVGYSDILLGYVSGCGDFLEECVENVYDAVGEISFKEVLYRPKMDFLADYPTSIVHRFKATNGIYFQAPDVIIEEKGDADFKKIAKDIEGLSSTLKSSVEDVHKGISTLKESQDKLGAVKTTFKDKLKKLYGRG